MQVAAILVGEREPVDWGDQLNGGPVDYGWFGGDHSAIMLGVGRGNFGGKRRPAYWGDQFNGGPVDLGDQLTSGGLEVTTRL